MRVSEAFTWTLLITTVRDLSASARPKDYSACGGTLTELQGRIVTYYGPKTFCNWTIHIKNTEYIDLGIPVLNFDCQNENLEIVDGPPGSLSLGKLCRGFNVRYRSSSNIVTVNYFRKSRQPPSVYNVNYFAIKKDYCPPEDKVFSGCGGIITSPKGRIINYVGKKTDCVWTIKMEPSYRIIIGIANVNLNCRTEKLEILDGTLDSEQHGRICEGYDLQFRSSSNIMTIHYSRTPQQRPSPFSAYYYTFPKGTLPTPGQRKDNPECGGLHTKAFGTIKKPVGYHPSCTWVIYLTPPQQIIMQISSAKLNCTHETLKIFDGPLWSPVLGDICAEKFLVLRSSSNVVTIKYTTKSAMLSPIFSVAYYVAPDGLAVLPKRKEESRKCDPKGWLSNPENSTSCVWTILLKPSYLGFVAFPFLGLPCENESAKVAEQIFGNSSFGKICPTMSFGYSFSSDRLTLSYPGISRHQPTTFKAYLYGDAPEEIESLQKGKGPEDCGDHLKHSSGKYLNSFGPRVVCVWRVYWKESEKFFQAHPLSNLSCASKEAKEARGPLGWDHFVKICETISFIYKPFSNYVTISDSRNSTKPDSVTEAFFHDFSKDSFSVSFCIPTKEEEF